jgi:hypothetical protein
MIRRILVVYSVAFSSEIDIGIVARSQMLPSSSLGMKSRPSSGKSATHAKMGMALNINAVFGFRSAASKKGF